jgi:hypothetical protein
MFVKKDQLFLINKFKKKSILIIILNFIFHNLYSQNMSHKEEILNLIEGIFKVEITNFFDLSPSDLEAQKLSPYLINTEIIFSSKNLKNIEKIWGYRKISNEFISLYILLPRDENIINTLNKYLNLISTGGVGINDCIDDHFYFWKWENYTLGLNKNINIFNKNALMPYYTLIISSYQPETYIKID